MPARPASSSTTTSFVRAPQLLVPVGILLGMLLLARLTSADASGAVILALARSLPLALVWAAAALGLGGILMRGIATDDEAGFIDTIACRAGIGVAGMLVLTTISARSGLLSVPAAAWILLGLPALLLFVPGNWPRLGRAWTWPSAVCIPPLATLFLAALSAPGWLWKSEFGGYDVMSYHLQLADTWVDAGRMMPVEHCVYSFLPSAMEATWYHLALVHGGAVDAAASCQLVHAIITVFAALAVGGLAHRITKSSGAGVIAALVLLGTPWTIVTGSMAYNEMTVVLMLATGWLLLQRATIRPCTAAALGLVVGCAIAAKPTAALFVALPLGLISAVPVWRSPFRSWAILAGVVGTMLPLAPWLIGNALTVGNPVFPFATDLLGAAHWSTDNAARWHAGHQSSPSLLALWDQWFRYGVGEGPSWTRFQPQWSLLPWILLAAGGLSVWPRFRSRAILAPAVITLTTLVCWMLFTHQQSRFLLTLVVPGSVVAAYLASRCTRSAMILLPVVAIYGLLPSVLYLQEAGGAPAAGIGAEPAFAGAITAALVDETDDPAVHEELRANAPAAWWINHALPASARIALIGDAAPLYYDRPDLTWSTTWDRAAGDAFEAICSDEHPFTHVLLDETMLSIWAASGWVDPRLDPVEDVIAALDARGTVLHRFADGKTLYELHK